MTIGIGQFGFGAKQHRYADAGAYFVGSNATPGTGIISGAVTSLADTTPYIVFKNNNTVLSGTKCYLDYLRLYVTVVGIGHTLPKVAHKLDASQSTTRYTSGGTVITPVNTNSDSSVLSAVQLYVGAITAAAAGSARLVNSHALANAIEVVYDSWVFDFGAPAHSSKTSLADNSTTITHGYFGEPPIVVGPQEHYLFHVWAGSMSTGITFGFDMGWVEI